MSGGAIVLNYKYEESTEEVVIWGSDSSSWSSEDGGWLEGVTVQFSYIIFVEEGGGGTYTEGWIEDSLGWRYQLTDGSFVTSAWRNIGGSNYYFKSNSYMASNEFITSDGSLAYLGNSGASDGHTYAWNSDSTGYWIYQTDGSWVPYSYWALIDGYWYYFNASGYMVTGVQVIDNIEYTFGDDGKLQS